MASIFFGSKSRQLAEQSLLIKGLKKENKQLQAENKAVKDAYNTLKSENEALKSELETAHEKYNQLESTMEEQIAAAVAKAVEDITAAFKVELNKAQIEIGNLKSMIKMDSSNSSKPPSTDGFKDIPNSRENSNKTVGGQKGHPGHRLELPEYIDELEENGMLERRLVDNTDGSEEYVSKFELDIEVKIILTEHRFAKGAEIPVNLSNEVSYGNNLKAKSILLLNEGTIAEKRLADIFRELTHGVITLSPATLENFQYQFAQTLDEAGELEAIKQDVKNSEVMNTDDTSVRSAERIVYPENENSDEKPKIERAEKKSFRVTVRTHSTETSTFYTVNPKKDIRGIERDGILPGYEGDLCHDHESKFFNYGKRNSSCGGHLSRELKGLRDLKHIEWADGMRKYITGMNDYKNRDLAAGITVCDPDKLSGFESEYDRLIKEGFTALGNMEGTELGYKKFNAMLNRLDKRKDSYMLFMRDYKVPFTNNLAERDLRPLKTKEKVSGLFRSWKGAETHTKNRSFISTAKKRGKNLYLAILDVISGVPVFRY